ncbi:inositol 3-kinase [Andrographis paniculata]|uniref:inositol 3-kinase n=1 Tax=Andrographis paniculata TaxID=175694 RepID=UPI0021E97356|nr:inositol 3-kinase [Andrographis paniculata]XP_051142947.1 inositol 3-kinase [Andrographis paniculata]XP_051142948.1 inositol 3-kinase [Andrographis paniculata]
MRHDSEHTSCLLVGNYCHDVLRKDGVVLTESLGGAAAFISAVFDGLSVPCTFICKVGSDFAYSVAHPPLISPSSNTTLFHANFSSQIQRHDRVLHRVHACDPIVPSDLPESRRFEFGLAVGVAGEISPATLEKMLDICDAVFVDIQALIRTFDPADGTVRLVNLRDSGFHHLIPRIRVLKASSDEAPYVDVEEARKMCCVVVTNGKEGCTVYHENVEQQVLPFPAVQADPTGAGDSFLGGLVVGISLGLAVPDAALLGNFFGSLTVEQIGLPKFDMKLLQAVKDEVHRKRLQLCSSRKDQSKDKLESAKSLDHEAFRATLVRTRALPLYPTPECQSELSDCSKGGEEHHPNGLCNDQNCSQTVLVKNQS